MSEESAQSASTGGASMSKRVPIHLQSAANRILIKHGQVVNAERVVRADIYVEEGVVKQMGEHLIIPGGTRVVDAANKLVLPAGIDLDVWLQKQMPHFNTQSIDDLYQGTRAAVAGGTTLVAAVAEVAEGESLVEAFKKWVAWGEQRACCDFVLKMRLSEINEQIKKEMEILVKDEAFGVNIFILDNLDDEDLLTAMEHCKSLGVMAQVRPECLALTKVAIKEVREQGVTGPEGLALAITEANEEAAVIRLITLAEHTKCPLIIGPLTCSRSVAAVDRQRSRGDRNTLVFAYTTPAALACDGDVYFSPSWHQAASFVCRPPLKLDQRTNLINAVAKKSLDFVASEHCTFSKRQRALGKNNFEQIPVGVNGVQSRLSVLWETCVHSDLTPEASGVMDACRFVEATSALPAKLLNLWPRRGRIEVGSHADLVIWNNNATRLISSSEHELKSDVNIFEGMRCHGVPELVITHNKPVVEEGGQLRVSEGMGKHVNVAPFSPFVFDELGALERPDALRRAIVRPDIDPSANGDKGDSDEEKRNDLPIPSLPPETKAVAAPSQHLSKLDLSQHAEPVVNNIDSPSTTRSSVRVRAPPGGKSSGGFW